MPGSRVARKDRLTATPKLLATLADARLAAGDRSGARALLAEARESVERGRGWRLSACDVELARVRLLASEPVPDRTAVEAGDLPAVRRAVERGARGRSQGIGVGRVLLRRRRNACERPGGSSIRVLAEGAMRMIVLTMLGAILVASEARGEQAAKPDEIKVLVSETAYQPTAYAAFPIVTYKVVSMPTEKLADEFKVFVERMGEALKKAPTTLGAYALDEIEFRAEVNAQGGVNLVGTATVGASGAITVKFKKEPQAVGKKP
jgi:hypothetical protein